MDLRHQTSAMCVIMGGGEDTHPWTATKGGNPIPATIPVATKNNQQTTHTSPYPRQIVLHVRQIGFRQIVFRQIVPYPVFAPAKRLK